MCGIGGILGLAHTPLPDLKRHLKLINTLLRHRGPDGEGYWQHHRLPVGFAHRRLSIIDLATGDQPMCDDAGNWVVFNGEIYNYIELRKELGEDQFRTTSDTEVILYAYRKWGRDCVNRFRGMFAFALWDETRQELFCSRDRFGIKPFYYTIVGDVFYFASEIKALLPFIGRIETDSEGLRDYLTFQYTLSGKTLFKNISELLPAHTLVVANGRIETVRFWEVYFTIDFDHTEKYFREKLFTLLNDSVNLHLRSDVPLGAYISGGLDSSVMASLAVRQTGDELLVFTGKFSTYGPAYDESRYARLLAERQGFQLYETDIRAADFIENIRKVIYYLDYPVAGPGSFPQYMVSRLASRHRKVVLGGLGGDEIFGGYTRYLIAYFEQCIKGAIEDTIHSGNFIVTYESIIPNLTALQNYQPLLKEFWRDGLFESHDRRYFRLVNRTRDLTDEINWELLGDYSPFDTFREVFYGKNVGKESYFDLMTHFDFKTLLPALLQVEDRMSMAHGIESRVPLLDHHLVEFAATIPSNIKFKNGTMKHIFREVVRPFVPGEIVNRKDKMGFPTPLTEWMTGEARDFVLDVFSSAQAQSRELINNRKIVQELEHEPKYGRKIWGFLSLELWQQEFHDREGEFRKMIERIEA